MVTKSQILIPSSFLDSPEVRWQNEFETLPPNFPVEDLCFNDDSDAPWQSISSAFVLPTAFSNSNTKVLSFPSNLPDYQTGFNYMDIYQPHGSQPTAKFGCAFWEAWKHPNTTWRCVASFSDHRVADAYRRYLHRANITIPYLSLLLSSHWVNLLRYIYKIAVNDGRLVLRNAAKDIEEIVGILFMSRIMQLADPSKRYRNSAKPSIASANAR